MAGGGCATVQSSPYAELAGVPVATLGLVAYLAILATALVRSPLAAATGAVLALAGLAFSVYLFVVQVAVIEELCSWCIASDALMAALALATLQRLRGI